MGLTPAEVSPIIGYHGVVTSTVDWCEENYIVSFYVAEYWNAISNMVFFVFVAIGLYSCRACKSEWRFVTAYLSLGIVGAGSTLFHGTLLYEFQLADELPMVYGMAAFVYCTLQMWPPERHSAILAISITLFCAVITVWYLTTRNFLVFAVAFFAELMIAAIAPIFYIRRLANTHLKEATRLGWLFATSIGAFAFAFALWIVDNTQCSVLRDWRAEVGYPLRVFSEFHA
ncbi:hypothetical protein SmJEL517_g04120 [Synchytrium microbalum]|uniref:Ceramidase n=1 Tax=Synchytrium microbalum TaxID=1806994 RepID=A0A507C409_9FUNG|nr:uncharacterized protein SmJEL517_g04120 [Synchytrium microbalum]TPX32844.1 hypothetical protein SmJEL517_g04120 [Synchytrium microbalum]